MDDGYDDFELLPYEERIAILERVTAEFNERMALNRLAHEWIESSQSSRRQVPRLPFRQRN